jgi:hypothetical protein
MRLSTTFGVLGVALLSATSAQAGPALDQAMQRIQAIAAGDVGAITAEYAKGATLHWVGGPLDGTYEGGKLKEVWTKFGSANGTLQAAVGTSVESANPKGATVAIPVVFTGKNTIKVRYTLVYRDGKLVGEVWQIDPNLPAT